MGKYCRKMNKRDKDMKQKAKNKDKGIVLNKKNIQKRKNTIYALIYNTLIWSTYQKQVPFKILFIRIISKYLSVFNLTYLFV